METIWSQRKLTQYGYYGGKTNGQFILHPILMDKQVLHIYITNQEGLEFLATIVYANHRGGEPFGKS